MKMALTKQNWGVEPKDYGEGDVFGSDQIRGSRPTEMRSK